jgi:hypothetical protein
MFFFCEFQMLAHFLHEAFKNINNIQSYRPHYILFNESAWKKLEEEEVLSWMELNHRTELCSWRLRVEDRCGRWSFSLLTSQQGNSKCYGQGSGEKLNRSQWIQCGIKLQGKLVTNMAFGLILKEVLEMVLCVCVCVYKNLLQDCICGWLDYTTGNMSILVTILRSTHTFYIYLIHAY